MPIYEYGCEACGHRFEVLQKLSDAPLTQCPSCGKPALKKLISPVGFRLKGTGWYETDFKQPQKKNRQESGEQKPDQTAKPAASETKTAPSENAKKAGA